MESEYEILAGALSLGGSSWRHQASGDFEFFSDKNERRSLALTLGRESFRKVITHTHNIQMGTKKLPRPWERGRGLWQVALALPVRKEPAARWTAQFEPRCWSESDAIDSVGTQESAVCEWISRLVVEEENRVTWSAANKKMPPHSEVENDPFDEITGKGSVKLRKRSRSKGSQPSDSEDSSNNNIRRSSSCCIRDEHKVTATEIVLYRQATVVSFEEAPPFLQFNQYILNGYRTNLCTITCLRRWDSFQVHCTRTWHFVSQSRLQTVDRLETIHCHRVLSTWREIWNEKGSAIWWDWKHLRELLLHLFEMMGK